MRSLILLYLATFIVYPLVAIFLSKHIVFRRDKYWLLGVLLLPFISFWASANSYSWVGNFFNYFWISLGYFFFCLYSYALARSKKLVFKIPGILGSIATVVGFIQLFFTFFAVCMMTIGSDSDKEYKIHHQGEEYIVRQYILSFVTLMNETHTFVTYKQCKNLPFEKRVDKASFRSQDDPPVDFRDPYFRIEIGGDQGSEWIKFSSLNGFCTKQLGEERVFANSTPSTKKEKTIRRPEFPRSGIVPSW
ncbi:hypothetical protein [Bacteroides sp. 224]|uniref:hypothetical protein n=1 Tax=Bacteroides sp. 224 TaxID=2302936 RepID=UPI0013D0C911|nr:hypothetical protein [Bacteroides sp. 224]NDV63737.1 hypothetical protein [Bacteroides sp. 224]